MSGGGGGGSPLHLQYRGVFKILGGGLVWIMKTANTAYYSTFKHLYLYSCYLTHAVTRGPYNPFTFMPDKFLMSINLLMVFIASSMNPDHTAPRSSLIRVHIVQFHRKKSCHWIVVYWLLVEIQHIQAQQLMQTWGHSWVALNTTKLRTTANHHNPQHKPPQTTPNHI